MDEETVRLLEDRVLKAVERLRELEADCRRLTEELEEARARLAQIERETWARAAEKARTVWSERVAEAVGLLREAVQELRARGTAPAAEPTRIEGEPPR
jgi:chromosome segregation ATPase